MFRLTGVHQGNTMKTHRRHHHDVYCHASLGAAAPDVCVNYTAVGLNAAATWLLIDIFHHFLTFYRPNVLLVHNPDVQLTVMEEERNQEIFIFKKF